LAIRRACRRDLSRLTKTAKACLSNPDEMIGGSTKILLALQFSKQEAASGF